jgi:2-polyprenyl-6-methoxyphenol hydroxylase-like FAD-dependent oxidoreductase
MTQPAFAILGGGPTALACALWCARQGNGKVKVLLSRKPAEEGAPGWIEAVPIHAMSGLVELGVHPHAIGVFGVMAQRMVAWSSAAPSVESTPAAAHIERPCLEVALLALAMRQHRIELCLTDFASARAEALLHARSGVAVIDATGRGAALAATRSRPPRPWVARLFHVPLGCAAPVVPFMIAALPQGYVYRSVGHRSCTVGVVGHGSLLAGRSVDVCERLRHGEAAWLVEDIAALPWTPAGARSASIQWAQSHQAALVGDAALARDALSSQGLASGLRDARYAAAVRTADDREAMRQRSRLSRRAHCDSLAAMIATCRWRSEPGWRDYAAFVTGAAQSA